MIVLTETKQKPHKVIRK